MSERTPAERQLRRALRFVLLSHLGTIVLMFTVAARVPVEVRDLPVRLWVLLLAIIAYTGAAGERWPIGARPATSRLWLALLTPIVANALGVLFGGVLAGLGGTQSAPASPEGGGAILGAVVLSAVLAPVGEELLFRGAVLPALRPWGDRVAIIGAAALFGVCHIHFLAFPWAFALGIICGIVAVEAKSIAPAIAFHALGNALGVILTTPPLRPVASLLEKYGTTWAPESPLALGAAVVTAAVGVGIYRRALRGASKSWAPATTTASVARALRSPAGITLAILYLLINVALTAAMLKGPKHTQDAGAPPAAEASPVVGTPVTDGGLGLDGPPMNPSADR